MSCKVSLQVKCPFAEKWVRLGIDYPTWTFTWSRCLFSKCSGPQRRSLCVDGNGEELRWERKRGQEKQRKEWRKPERNVARWILLLIQVSCPIGIECYNLCQNFLLLPIFLPVLPVKILSWVFLSLSFLPLNAHLSSQPFFPHSWKPHPPPPFFSFIRFLLLSGKWDWQTSRGPSRKCDSKWWELKWWWDMCTLNQGDLYENL